MDKDSGMGDMDFGLPTDLPDFSQVGRMFNMLSWLPAIFTAVVLFVLSFLAQVIYNGLTQSDYNITYGAFMIMILISLVIAVITGALVKVATSRKMRLGTS